MNFRLATILDLPILNHISFQSKAYWGYPSDWMDKWKDDLMLEEANIKNENVLVLEVEGKIIGFCSFIEKLEEYEVLHLWILPTYIGKGYGKKLLDKTISTFVEIAKPIVVTADPNAEGFYSQQGFISYDKVESYPKGRFLPVMKRG